MTRRINIILSMFAIVVGAVTAGASAQPSHVKVVKNGQDWQLLVNGQPFYIKGAAGNGSKQLLVKSGGNSFRTWGVGPDTPGILEEAQRLGLKVTLGIWLGHKEHGFNYNNADQVAKQFAAVRAAVEKYRNSPALLMWGIGNEMEGYGKGDNAAVWSDVEACAAMVHRLDPNHPTMTVVAEIGGDRVKNINRLCPSIDVIGINSYAGVTSIPQRYRKAGGTKPYVVTEYGPPGVWEVGRNAWGVPVEMTSTQKAKVYRGAYEKLRSDRQDCLGSYAFTWGSKQEATATWFGMLLPDGSKLGAVDALTKAWSGHEPEHLCPVVEPIQVQGSEQVKPGATVHASIQASEPGGGKLKYHWVLMDESGQYETGGDAQRKPKAYPDAITQASNSKVTIQMPNHSGKYRLFVFIHNAYNGAATANLPLNIPGGGQTKTSDHGGSTSAQANSPHGAKTTLPLKLLGDGIKPPYTPSGWMGDTKSIKMTSSTDDPHTGKTCTRCQFTNGSGWGGVVWQNPLNNWGEKAGGYDLSGAKKLVFWARGESGGESVKFGFGLIHHDKPHYDTASGDKTVTLTRQWKKYTIDLSGKNMSQIITGFMWVVGGQGKPVTFYLDDVSYQR